MKTLSSYSTSICSRKTHFKRLGVCVTSVSGVASAKLQTDFVLHGTLALLLCAVFTDQNPNVRRVSLRIVYNAICCLKIVCFQIVLNDCLDRLESILANKPVSPAIPVALIATGTDVPSDDTIFDCLRVNVYMRKNLVSNFSVYRIVDNFRQPMCTKTVSFAKCWIILLTPGRKWDYGNVLTTYVWSLFRLLQLIDAVSCLGQQCPCIPRISSCSVAEFVETNVLSGALRRICEDKEQRSRFGLLQQVQIVFICFGAGVFSIALCSFHVPTSHQPSGRSNNK